MTKCPRCCSDEVDREEREYGPFHVKQYACSGCDKNFMEYYKDSKLSHTIPKAKI